jgi:hypothetical protein
MTILVVTILVVTILVVTILVVTILVVTGVARDSRASLHWLPDGGQWRNFDCVCNPPGPRASGARAITASVCVLELCENAHLQHQPTNRAMRV